MTTIDQAIQRFREEFGGVMLVTDNDKWMISQMFGEKFEAFLRQELTDFAREVEEKVIGDEEATTEDLEISKYDGVETVTRDRLRTKQRQALHQLIGEEGQNAPKIT